MWFLATPVGGAGIAAGQHAGALQLVARQTGEESLPSRVETAHRHITVERPLRKDAAQHEGCGDTDGRESHKDRWRRRRRRRRIKEIHFSREVRFDVRS